MCVCVWVRADCARRSLGQWLAESARAAAAQPRSGSGSGLGLGSGSGSGSGLAVRSLLEKGLPFPAPGRWRGGGRLWWRRRQRREWSGVHEMVGDPTHELGLEHVHD